MDFFNLGKEINVLKQEVKEAFKKVREESDMHLDSINENTDEIQVLHGMYSELDEKIEKLSDKIDNIYLVLEKAGLIESKVKFSSFDVSKLSNTEKEIYNLLISSDKELSLIEISHYTGLDQISIQDVLAYLIKKGVPIIQKFVNSDAFFSIEEEFKIKAKSFKLSMLV